MLVIAIVLIIPSFHFYNTSGPFLVNGAEVLVLDIQLCFKSREIATSQRVMARIESRSHGKSGGRSTSYLILLETLVQK